MPVPQHWISLVYHATILNMLFIHSEANIQKLLFFLIITLLIILRDNGNYLPESLDIDEKLEQEDVDIH